MTPGHTIQDEKYVPLIHLVTQADDVVALNILLKHGARADVMSREPQFNSPLHAAVRQPLLCAL